MGTKAEEVKKSLKLNKKPKDNVKEKSKQLTIKKSSSQKLHKKDFLENTVYLFQFTRTPLLPSLSCYCLKVEAWLRLTGAKYENIDHKLKYRSSRGQLPFVELNGEHIADSDIIIKVLSEKFGTDLDAVLSTEQRSISHAAISMLDNHFAWVVMWWRAQHPSMVLKGYKVDLQHALGTRIPKGILNFFFKSSFKRRGKKKVKAQGMGSHTFDEITDLGQSDLEVLSNLLGDSKFFFSNDRPCNLDIVAFSHLAQVFFIDDTVYYPLKDFLKKSCPNLIELTLRVKEACFPDWDKICSTLEMNTHLSSASI